MPTNTICDAKSNIEKSTLRKIQPFLRRFVNHIWLSGATLTCLLGTNRRFYRCVTRHICHTTLKLLVCASVCPPIIFSDVKMNIEKSTFSSFSLFEGRAAVRCAGRFSGCSHGWKYFFQNLIFHRYDTLYLAGLWMESTRKLNKNSPNSSEKRLKLQNVSCLPRCPPQETTHNSWSGTF